MPDLRSAMAMVEGGLYVPTYSVLLRLDTIDEGQFWRIEAEGVIPATSLTAATNDPEAAKTEADAMLWSLGFKRISNWNLSGFVSAIFV